MLPGLPALPGPAAPFGAAAAALGNVFFLLLLDWRRRKPLHVVDDLGDVQVIGDDRVHPIGVDTAEAEKVEEEAERRDNGDAPIHLDA